MEKLCTPPMEILKAFHAPDEGNVTMVEMLPQARSSNMKVSHLLVSMCVGYITLLIITAAILWYVIHMYQRGYADAIAEELYRKTFDLNPNLGAYRASGGGLAPSRVPRPQLTSGALAARRNCGSQTDANPLVDALFRRMEQYRLADKNIDKFLAGPNNRSILCASTVDYVRKF